MAKKLKKYKITSECCGREIKLNPKSGAGVYKCPKCKKVCKVKTVEIE